MASQAYQLQVFFNLIPFGRNLKEDFENTNFARLRECLGLGICTNLKPTCDFPIPLNTKFCSVCRRLVGILMSNYAPQPELDPPFEGLSGS